MTKKCTRCGESKVLEGFALDLRIKSGRGSQCKACIYERSSDWRKAHPEHSRAYQVEYAKNNRAKLDVNLRKHHLKKAFGLTIEQYDKMVAAQGGVCAICDGPPRGNGNKFLAVDHSHKTGRVRGLLCGLCNAGLGGLRDSIYHLEKALEYLKIHGE